MESFRLRELRAFVATRRYVAGRAELLAHGFRKSTIGSWVRRGRLVTVIHGVYSYGRDIETPGAAWQAALIAAGPNSVLAGRSACELWGMVRQRSGIPRLIEVIRQAGDPATLKGLSAAMRNTRIKVARRELRPDEIRRKAELALTSPARSLIDFAASATPVEVKFAFLEGCRLGLLNQGDITYCYHRLVRRRGATSLRPLLALWVPELKRIRSVLEGIFLLAWIEAGHTAPRVNVRVEGYEVDFYWPGQRVVLELDGAAFHSDSVSRRRDAKKDQDLEAQGILVVRVTYREMRDHPERVVARIEATLAGR